MLRGGAVPLWCCAVPWWSPLLHQNPKSKKIFRRCIAREVAKRLHFPQRWQKGCMLFYCLFYYFVYFYAFLVVGFWLSLIKKFENNEKLPVAFWAQVKAELSSPLPGRAQRTAGKSNTVSKICPKLQKCFVY